MAHIGGLKRTVNDEMFTPPVMVEAIIPHVNRWLDTRCQKRKPCILMPFDTIDSEFFWAFKYRLDVEVILGHLSTGQDFFTYNYDWSRIDLVLSNPPFSRKLDVFKKLFDMRKPFAMIGNMMMLNHHEIGDFFSHYPIQILSFNKRVSFNGKGSSFMSGYFCHDFLESDLMFQKLTHNNTGRYFVPSRMMIAKQNEQYNTDGVFFQNLIYTNKYPVYDRGRSVTFIPEYDSLAAAPSDREHTHTS